MQKVLFVDKIFRESLEDIISGNIVGYDDSWLSCGKLSEDFKSYVAPLDQLYFEILRKDVSAVFSQDDSVAANIEGIRSRLLDVVTGSDIRDTVYIEGIGSVERAYTPECLKALSPLYRVVSPWYRDIMFRVAEVPEGSRDRIEVCVMDDWIYLIESFAYGSC